MVEAAERATTLIAIARHAIAQSQRPTVPSEWTSGWLHERAATFVTLKLDGDLRGCVGSVVAHRPLGEDVAHNAYAAAYRDPRFAPVDESERARLAVEVSVLSEQEFFLAPTEDAAMVALRPGVDGIHLEFGGMRATFLPQVWESIPDPLEFLCELRRKAGLPTRFWHEGVRLSRYTVVKYK